MSFPSTTSKFAGKCTVCKKKYEKGTIIYKINEQYWCSDVNCGQTTQKTEQPIDLEAKLDQMWQVSYAKASKIIDETYNDQELPDKFERKKQKLIMAQTFIKSLCGHGD